MRKLTKSMPEIDLPNLLHRTFGHTSFRPNQKAVCEAATAGRDLLLVMPTGAGKSLCYQLPAIARGGTALVISPLIALMDDQAAKLSALGLRVARIHSGLSRDLARQACRDYLDGTLHFLFIAPERLRVPGFPEMLARRKPSLVAIDEAHCISAWGHDFRPDYRTLGDHLPSLRPAPVLALTATATPAVQADIVKQLGLQDPALFIHGFRRSNLAIEAVEMSKPRRNEFVVNFLADPTNRPAIVYAPSRKSAEELAGLLGPRAAAYHAGLDPGTRDRVQTAFLSGGTDVVVATIAFGMGIDKADVRTVIHTALPASVEGYYQEIGRAGRDGQPARTVLLHSFADRKMHDFFLERDYPAATELARVAAVLTPEYQSPRDLAHRLKMDPDVVAKSLDKLASQGAASFSIENYVRATGNPNWRTGYDAQLAFRRQQIDRMAAFAESHGCRMSALIQHFGDTADGLQPCGVCDVCSPASTAAQTFRDPISQEQTQLRAILRALETTGRSTGKLHTDLSPTAPFRGTDRSHLDHLLDGLARAGLLTLANDTFINPEGRSITYKKATLTHEGRFPEAGDLPVTLPESEPARTSSGKDRISTAAATARSSRPSKAAIKAERDRVTSSYTPAQQALEARLREWRKSEAAKTGKPAFMVFGDSTLGQIVVAAPTTLPALMKATGFNQDRADRYGADILALCRDTETTSPLRRPASPLPTQPVSATPRPPQPPSAPLTPAQQALDTRLRAWRAAEADRLNLPHFFVLGASTLRSLVLRQPQTLADLRGIEGLDQEKSETYGDALLALCRGEVVPGVPSSVPL